MTCTFRWMTFALLASGAHLVVPAPSAEAGGIGFTVSPKGEEAEVLRAGLSLYSTLRSMRKSTKNRAKVEQVGEGNGAAISQQGQNNRARVYQRGRGNSGSISQNGDDNAFALVQFGKRNNTHVSQTGNGNAGVRFEWGW